MSHFTVLVVVDGDTKESAIESALTDILEPFDEQRETPRYRKLTREEAIKEERERIEERKRETYDKWVADPEGYEKGVSNPGHLRYLKTLPKITSDGNALAVVGEEHHSFIEDYERITGSDEGAWQEAIRWVEPEDVQEDGIYSTYNPNSKWDWWSIGGRWSGAFLNAVPVGKAKDYFTGEPFTVFGNGVDILRRRDLRRPESPFAILTKNGEWHEKGQMGWFGMASNEAEQSDWDKQVADILQKVDGKDWLVLVDCHI